MSQSQQLANARVNISVQVPTEGALKKTTLPMKCLILGDFSRKQTLTRFRQSARVPVNATNLNAVIKRFQPSLTIEVKAVAGVEATMPIALTFSSLQDFSPDAIAKKIPKLANWVAMRNLLKDLKANLSDNRKLHVALARIMTDEKKAKQLMEALQARGTLR